MKQNLLFYLTCFAGFFALVLIPSCDDDDSDGGNTSSPIASFQLAVSETNFLEVTFTNFSQNATSYMWDFGDGNTSTQENPTHIYTGGGNYTISLMASNADNQIHTFTRTLEITDPNDALKALTSETSKIWKLSRNVADEEYPIEVGPSDLSQIWWALGLNDELGTRVCLMEEEYIFNLDGTYEYKTDGTVFADYGIWNEDAAGNCIDETDATAMTSPTGEDLSAWGSGTFTFEYDPINATLTVTGLGAHVGLPKVSTTSEVSTPQASVTYNVVSLTTEGPIDKLILETTIDGGYWRFFLVSYDDPNDEPDLPGAAPTTSFTSEINGREVTFDNTTANADSYMWDFGDGNMSTEEDPVHTYAADGQYTVKLTATNMNGSREFSSEVIISATTFSEEVLHGGSSKAWKISPIAGALTVGPNRVTGGWWANTEEDVTKRACTFDDTYTFHVGGTYDYETNGDVWAESYFGVDNDTCYDESDIPAEAAAWGAGTHNFIVDDANEIDPAYITVMGTGAFLALPKAYNGGEFTAPPPPVDGMVKYEVHGYLNDGGKETLILIVDITDTQRVGYWTFTLETE